MKILKANEAKDLTNKFHMKQTEETSKLIQSHLAKIFNNSIKTIAKSGKAEVNINDVVNLFENNFPGGARLNRALIAESVKQLALLNDYKVLNNIIYW